MEQDGPGGAGGETVVDMGVPEAATWPEELPEAERTASTPRPWVSLYLDNGAFPSRRTMTEYLVENGQAVRAREVGLSPYWGGQWLAAPAGEPGGCPGRGHGDPAVRPLLHLAGGNPHPRAGVRIPPQSAFGAPWPPHRSGGGGGGYPCRPGRGRLRHGGYGLFSAYHHPGQRGLRMPWRDRERTAAPRVRGARACPAAGAAPSVSAWNIWAVAPRALPPTRPSIIP